SHSVSVHHANLPGVFENHLEAVLRMILDKSRQLDVAVFENLRRLLVFFEQLGDRAEDHRGQRFARRAEVQKISIALGRVADPKNPAADARLAPGQGANLFHFARRELGQIGRRRLRRGGQRREAHPMNRGLAVFAGIGDLGARRGRRRVPALIEKMGQKAGAERKRDQRRAARPEPLHGFRSQSRAKALRYSSASGPASRNTSRFSSLALSAARVQLYEPAKTIWRSMTANFWCIRALSFSRPAVLSPETRRSEIFCASRNLPLEFSLARSNSRSITT